jgi:hypothetical protein
VPVVILMMSNLSLKVLVWDEYVESAKQLLRQAVEIARQSHSELNENLDEFLQRQEDGKIARLELQVLGIRDVKGAEYDDILILNFFSAKVEASDGSGEMWPIISTSCGKSWKLLAQSDDASAVQHGITDLQVELQLKMLYTACSRCRCRLIFIETEETVAGLNFFKKLRALEFISLDSKSSDILFDEKGKTKVQDDWASEAVLFLSYNFVVFNDVLWQVMVAQSIPDMHNSDRMRARDLVIKVRFSLIKACLSNCPELLQCDA